MQSAVTENITGAITALCGAEHTASSRGVITVAPADTDQVASVLRLAGQAGLAVEPRGAGTKTAWLNDGRTSLILQTHRFSALREHIWQDMTCTVGAGCAWSALQSALARHGQFVALDPLWPDRATVGGIIAANDSGALRLRYGGLRDIVLGMTIVLADGTVARSGGKVVKNVAGYDLHKLMCGAFGTLGIVTEVTFRLHAIPGNTATLTVVSPSAEPLGNLLLQLLDSHFSTQSMQLRASGEAFALDIRLAAIPEVLMPQTESLIALAGKQGLSAQPALPEVWSAREKVMEHAAAFKATMLPDEISRASAAVLALGGTAVIQATGIMTGSVPSVACFPGLIALRRQLESSGGSLTLLSALPEAQIDRWGRLPQGTELMREIRRRFDPGALLNPGRFLGGI
ncbi:FAD-binding oxidoreductase [Paracidobacterium acidisoli]|nr:FAD-binding oxidoreductase [Paracidobacterium acidisoli]MBT9332202.1 FAD-binding oxidoreductase [Paracidobacterium acidisoli]